MPPPLISSKPAIPVAAFSIAVPADVRAADVAGLGVLASFARSGVIALMAFRVVHVPVG
jgi:hypothetical protein